MNVPGSRNRSGSVTHNYVPNTQYKASQVAQWATCHWICLPTQKMQFGSLDWEDPLEKETATHSSILAWTIPLDRKAWQATTHGVAKSWTRLRTKQRHHPGHPRTPVALEWGGHKARHCTWDTFSLVESRDSGQTLINHSRAFVNITYCLNKIRGKKTKTEQCVSSWHILDSK